MRVRDARPAFEAISDLTEEVSISGQKGKLLILKEDAAQLRSSRDLPPRVRLLPQFDALIMGHKDKSRFMRTDDRKSVFLPRADVSATILLDGRIRGTWNIKKQKKTRRVTLSPFDEIDGDDRRRVEEEVDLLADFTGFEIETSWAV